MRKPCQQNELQKTQAEPSCHVGTGLSCSVTPSAWQQLSSRTPEQKKEEMRKEGDRHAVNQ